MKQSMKIGIITWFTGPNYGTNLQAIALQYYLRRRGYEVNLINYEVPSGIVIREKKFFIRKLLYQPKKYAIKFAMNRYKYKIAERDRKLRNSIVTKCNLTPEIKSIDELVKTCNEFDLLICGSDQIWNPNWYDKFYYADYNGIFADRISYAPSMGVNAIPDSIVAEIQHGLKYFKAVSVREEKAAELLAPYLNEKPQVVVDPTLLLTSEEWMDIFPDDGYEDSDYVFAFFLNDEKKHLEATKRFARILGYKLILVPYKGVTYLQNADIRADAGLEDMLNLIRNAKYVITDSFHITVFSIIHRKQFYTFQRFKEDEFTSQNVRVTNLLNIVDLPERLIPYQSTKIDMLDDINYDGHIEKLNIEIEKSKEFLENSIE
ncbi:TPA: polysaccharide pyruvyl transferase family protein [Streptococcus suis]